MCGIAVVVAKEPDQARSVLKAMVCAQTHRGPDDEGTEFVSLGSSTIGLGQRRLSIIDLSPLGHQPMVHPGNGDLLIYNGELYNYREIRSDLEAEGLSFRGGSDTEVLLHALVRWGPSCLGRMRGMFALAWYRSAQRVLVLARDPLGIKPLYVSKASGSLLVASEVRAVLASGLVERAVNPRGVATYLAFGSVQEPDTIIAGVQAFPAGHWQEIPLETALEATLPRPVRYWRPPPVDESISHAEAIERVRSSLDESVRDHLISDVPLGVFLSSGIDSTIIAGLAARHGKGLSSYTVGFADNQDMSESAPASTTARMLGLRHVDVQITTEQALASVERWLNALDQPSIDGLNTYVVSGAVKQAGITVALSGLGGDELFCGYGSFVDVPRLQALMHRAQHLPRWVRILLGRAASLGKSTAYKHKLDEIARSSGSLIELYFQRRRVLSGLQLSDLGVRPGAFGLAESFMPPEALADLDIDERDPIVAVSTLETRFYAGNMLLRDSDATGMAHSLEIRVPFFDTGVLDAVMPIPGRVRMPQGMASKYLLRRAFPDLLREDLLKQSKRGFSLPISRWMSTSLRGLCEESLSDLKRSGVLEVSGINSLWRSYLTAPQTQIWSRAFALCVLGSYVTQNVNHRAPLSVASSTPIDLTNPHRTRSAV